MKNLLIIILVLIGFKSEAQVDTLQFYTLQGNQLIFNGGQIYVNKNIITKDTSYSDTTRVDFLAIDYPRGETKNIMYVEGYRVDMRKGEYSSSQELGPCPNATPGWDCGLAHLTTVYNKPPIIKTFYLGYHKGRMSSTLKIKEFRQ